MNEELKHRNALIFSYLSLRRAIGLLGILFPFVLFFGALILFRTGLQSSISSYYYTGMRNVYVGVLCVIGFFLFSYKGYQRADDIAGDLGCVFAVGVAFFPTAPDTLISANARVIGYIHFAFAALFFLTLAFFSLRLFTKKHKDKPATPQKLQRNKLYKTCGWTMLLCLLLIAVYKLFLPDSPTPPVTKIQPVFWLESIAIVAFGVSWLTKGETIFKDEAPSSSNGTGQGV